jgi:putative ABC transport system permease protein
MSAFQLAFLHLFRKKLTTIIAIASLSLSVAAGGILVKLYALSHSRFSSLALQGDAIIGAKAGGLDILLGALNLEGPYPEYMPHNLFESLRKQKTVVFADNAQSTPNYIQSIIPLLYFADYKNYRVIGTDDSFLNRPRSEDSPIVIKGRWLAGPNEVVLGSETANRERLLVDDNIIISSLAGAGIVKNAKHIQKSVKIVGIFAPTHTIYDAAIISSINDGRLMITDSGMGNPVWKGDVLSYCLVYLEPGTLPQLTSLVNQRTVAQVVSVTEQYNRLKDLAGTGQTMGLVIISLILLLGGLGVISSMISRFEAMSLQVAVLKAIGYSRLFIGRWLLWEGLLLGTLASAVGGIFDLLFFPLIRDMLGSAIPRSPLANIPFYQSATVWAAAITGIILGVLIPFVRFNRSDAHTLLKGL